MSNNSDDDRVLSSASTQGFNSDDATGSNNSVRSNLSSDGSMSRSRSRSRSRSNRSRRSRSNKSRRSRSNRSRRSRSNKRSRTRRQRGGDPEDDVFTYYNMLQQYKKMIKDIEKQHDHDPKDTQYFQKKVDDWTKKLQDLPNSESIMKQYKMSV